MNYLVIKRSTVFGLALGILAGFLIDLVWGGMEAGDVRGYAGIALTWAFLYVNMVDDTHEANRKGVRR